MCLGVEELLINFWELIGSHSGENMAEVVWATMELYGLVGKVQLPRSGNMYQQSKFFQVIAIVMDNASNNNTLLESLQCPCEEQGIPFSAQDAHM